MAPLNYAAQYGRELANAYPYLSYYGDLWNAGESQRFKPLQGKTVYIPSMTTTGATAVNRDAIDGSFTRNFDLSFLNEFFAPDRTWNVESDLLLSEFFLPFYFFFVSFKTRVESFRVFIEHLFPVELFG